MKRFSAWLAVLFVLTSPLARADWHGGKVTTVQIAYDGSMIVFTLAGHTRTNCTCYPTWPSTLCLNRSRVSHKEEVAMLYSVRARGTDLFVNIDEASCSVVAMYEAG